MRAASTHHLVRSGLVLLAVLGLAGAGLGVSRLVAEQSRRGLALAHAQQLWESDWPSLPRHLDRMGDRPDLWRDEVARAAAGTDEVSERRTRAYLALARHGEAGVDYLRGRLLDADEPEQGVIRDELRRWKHRVAPALWSRALDPRSAAKARLAAALALADYEPGRRPMGIDRQARSSGRCSRPTRCSSTRGSTSSSPSAEEPQGAPDRGGFADPVARRELPVDRRRHPGELREHRPRLPGHRGAGAARRRRHAGADRDPPASGPPAPRGDGRPAWPTSWRPASRSARREGRAPDPPPGERGRGPPRPRPRRRLLAPAPPGRGPAAPDPAHRPDSRRRAQLGGAARPGREGEGGHGPPGDPHRPGADEAFALRGRAPPRRRPARGPLRIRPRRRRPRRGRVGPDAMGVRRPGRRRPAVARRQAAGQAGVVRHRPAPHDDRHPGARQVHGTASPSTSAAGATRASPRTSGAWTTPSRSAPTRSRAGSSSAIWTTCRPRRTPRGRTCR